MNGTLEELLRLNLAPRRSEVPNMFQNEHVDTRTFQNYDRNNSTAQQQVSRALSGGYPFNRPEGEAGDYFDAVTAGLKTIPIAGIVSPSVAKTLNTTLQMPENPIFREAVANTPNAVLTADGLAMRLQRNQGLEQAYEPSVRGGVFYLPEGAAQAKHYSTGKNGYGGIDKITGETLIQNPLLAKGGTGGKAPEAAYDALLGKNSYQDMRNEALKAMGGYYTKYYEKVDGVRSFLEKHAPELSDQAEYIVRNSKQGNQLPYALQEAAVASAVRNAGHDAVVGYSKGKTGNFLSEIYDVRESHYPGGDGTSEVWDKFKGLLTP